jgi:hypothetical protein
MAEVQQNTQSGETAARFIEFVMMQAQNASLFLGLIPNPSTNQPEVNLELARLFIDQLSMIQEKTRGNLNTEETGVLRNALTHLQMAFVEVSQEKASGGKRESAKPFATPVQDAEAGESGTASPTASADPAAAVSAEEQRESKKRFTKSYGG